MNGIQYRWMTTEEVDRVGEIDRSERIRKAYAVQGGALRAREVQWDVPDFLAEGDGEHSVAAQVSFCRAHLSTGGLMVGAFSGGTLVGVAVIRFEIRTGIDQLAYLQVSSGYRRKGVGRQLLEEVVGEAKRRGAQSLVVSATPSASAIGFYRKSGFRLETDPIQELVELEPEDIQMMLRLG